jgi:hypothetical protein
MNNCYFCHKLTTDTVNIWMGAGVVNICIACDDRMVSYSMDEEG